MAVPVALDWASRHFLKELLRDEGKVIGLLDGRVTGFPVDPVASAGDYERKREKQRGHDQEQED